MNPKVILSPKAPAPEGAYSHGIVHNNLLFTCGYIGINPTTHELAVGVENQTHMVLSILSEIAKSAGTSLENSIKNLIFLTNLNDFSSVNEIYKSYFKNSFPARSCVEVAALPMNALVQIEAIIAIK